MIGLAVLVGALLTVLPVFVVLAWHLRRDEDAGALALGIPLAVAVDLLVVLLISRLVRLEFAAVIARGLWLVAGIALPASPSRRSWAWPRALTPRLTATVIGVATLAVLLSMHLSRPYAIWDREWHIPLVGSLRGQRLPFANVFDSAVGLHYHFSGDVFASVVQTLSGCVLHSSLALSVAHDVLFGETAASLALLFAHFGVRGSVGLGAAVFGVLLNGPATVLLEGASRPTTGYSVLNYVQMSFRPHVALAGLLFVGIFGAILVRLRAPRGQLALRRTAPVLFASVAVLAITDEVSTGLLGLAIGAAWLIDADVLHRRRAVGVAMLSGLLAAIVLANRVFGASFGAGAPHHKVTLVPWRAPGYTAPELALATPAARWTVISDFLPVAAIVIAGAVIALRSRRREVRPTFVALSCLATVSFLCLTRVDIDGARIEIHRFATAALYAAPLLGVVWAARARHHLGLAQGLVYAAIGLASGSTVEWIADIAPALALKSTDFHKPEDLHHVNCHDVGSRFGDRTELAYIDASIWNLYAGCRPVFAPGLLTTQHGDLQTAGPTVGLPALAEVERLVGGKNMTVICATDSEDPTCRKLLLNPSRCEPAGQRAMHCTARAQDRR